MPTFRGSKKIFGKFSLIDLAGELVFKEEKTEDWLIVAATKAIFTMDKILGRRISWGGGGGGTLI